MSFYKRYELARLVREDEAKSFSGTQIETGRPVMLHMLDGKVAEELRPMIEGLRAEAHPVEIIETGDFAGSYYVVTATLQPFDGLRAWLENLSRSPVQPAAPPFDIPQQVATPSIPPPPPPMPPKVETAGEFTRMFPMEPMPARGADIGEFARIFDAPPKSEPVPPPKPADNWNAWPESATVPRPTDGPGEFTRFFGGSIPAERVNIEAEQAQQAQLNEAPDSRPFQQASEFTRMFGPAVGKAAAPMVPPQLPTSADQPVASRLFKPGELKPALAADEPLKSVPSSSEPGEYTRMIRMPVLPEQPAPVAIQPTSQPAAPPAKSRSVGKIVLFIFAGLAGLSLLAFLIYFVQAHLTSH